jgi:hypothetical protein
MRKTLAWALAGLTAATASAQTADEIIAKHVQARGGMDKIKAVKSMRMTGKMTLGQGTEALFVREKARPRKVRTEITVQGMTGIQVYDGTSGWSLMPFMGKKDPEPITGDDLQEMDEQADLDGPLVDYKDKGSQVELAGKADVEGAPAYKLKVTKKNGDVEYHYIDAGQYLEVKVEGKRIVRGQTTEGEATFGDYKQVDGLAFPFSIQLKQKGAPAGTSMTVDRIEVNPEVAASRFEKPAPAAPAAPVKQ